MSADSRVALGVDVLAGRSAASFVFSALLKIVNKRLKKRFIKEMPLCKHISNSHIDNASTWNIVGNTRKHHKCFYINMIRYYLWEIVCRSSRMIANSHLRNICCVRCNEALSKLNALQCSLKNTGAIRQKPRSRFPHLDCRSQNRHLF